MFYMSLAQPLPVVDVLFENHGSICILQPLTEDGRVWIEANVQSDRMFYGGGLVVEPRYVDVIVNGMINDGLSVQ